MATGETQGQPATIRLPREVSRSLDLVVDLTDGRYRDRDGLVAEIVRDWLAAAVQLGHEPTPRTRGTDGRTDVPARAGAPNVTGPPGTDSERDARARAMHALYLEGATLEEVGELYGVSRERVRQVFRDRGFRSRTRKEASAIRLLELERRGGEVAELFREEGTVEAVADRLGLPVPTVRRLIRNHLPDARAYRRQPLRKHFGDEELLEMLRDARPAEGRPLTARRYQEYARGRAGRKGRPWPTAQVFAQRFGSWTNALARAGIRANPPSPAARLRRFSDVDCVRAIRDLHQKLGRLPSAQEYGEYARAEAPWIPGLSTVRLRLGSWSQALRRALDQD